MARAAGYNVIVKDGLVDRTSPGHRAPDCRQPVFETDALDIVRVFGGEECDGVEGEMSLAALPDFYDTDEGV